MSALRLSIAIAISLTSFFLTIFSEDDIKYCYFTSNSSTVFYAGDYENSYMITTGYESGGQCTDGCFSTKECNYVMQLRPTDEVPSWLTIESAPDGRVGNLKVRDGDAIPETDVDKIFTFYIYLMCSFTSENPLYDCYPPETLFLESGQPFRLTILAAHLAPQPPTQVETETLITQKALIRAKCGKKKSENNPIDFINVIRWKANRQGGEIAKFQIYSKKDPIEPLLEIPYSKLGEKEKFVGLIPVFNNKILRKQVFFLKAVDRYGNKSSPIKVKFK